MESRELLLTWLNNAYAMEQGLIEVLENHANQARDFPDLQDRLRQHLEETRSHADRVKDTITMLGGEVSAVKSALGNVMGAVQGMSSGTMEDALVRNAISDYAAEHMEIASYRALGEAAQELEEPEVARMCEDILHDEEAMAEWLDEQLPTLVTTYLSQKVGQRA